MKLIEFFGLKVKPRITHGKHMFKPLITSRLSNHLYAIKDKDVNCFLIEYNDGYIAIDSGYKNSKNMRLGLDKLGINPDLVKHVFLTHLDIDHAGGMDINQDVIFKNAKIYLSKKEYGYITKESCRKKILGIKLKMPINLSNNLTFVSDEQDIMIGNITIHCVFAPGHSVGHTCYILENILFIGDALISDGNVGWCFYDFWNMDTTLNKKTLIHLEDVCKQMNIKTVITSHSGMLEESRAFVNKFICPKWKKKGFCFIPDAPIDPYADEA